MRMEVSFSSLVGGGVCWFLVTYIHTSLNRRKQPCKAESFINPTLQTRKLRFKEVK